MYYLAFKSDGVSVLLEHERLYFLKWINFQTKRIDAKPGSLMQLKFETKCVSFQNISV